MTGSGNRTGDLGGSSGDSFADTDWFTPVQASTTTAVLNEDFRAWRSEFPDFYDALGDPRASYGLATDDALDDYSSSLAVTPSDVRTALGPQADELMAAADVDVDELIRLINAETTVIPVIPAGTDRRTAGRPAAAAELDEPETGLLAGVKRWKKTALKATIASILVSLIGGGAAAIAMNKSVTVSVDGKTEQVNTYADTVGEVLESEGLNVGAHDALSPSPNAGVDDGSKIVLQRGRQLQLTVDGEQRDVWVRATTVSEALKQANLPVDGAWVSEDKNAPVPLEGMALEVKTVKGITLFDGGNKPKSMETTAVTVDELLAELELDLGKNDTVRPRADMKITDGANVKITRNGVTVVNETERVEPPVRTIDDPEMEAGKEVVLEAGKFGERIATYRITLKNGQEVSREEIGSKITKKPQKRVVRVGTKQPEISDGAVWDQLAQCESGGNWSINTGNGYYGGLQFSKPTWDGYGGGQYAAYPHEATREQQIAIATKMRDANGGSYAAWPHCSAQLGLPR